MKIFAIGDLVGEGGVKKLKEELPKIRQQENIDFVIVNAENAAGGMGITTKIFNELKEMKIDAITMGNHTWGKKDIFSFIDNEKIIRPANYPENIPGKGYRIYTIKSKMDSQVEELKKWANNQNISKTKEENINNSCEKKICVMNLIGRTDMNVLSENPFLKANEIIEEVKDKVNMIILDFHAEATAEKIAMGYYLDGKITAIFGTHTHVQTADEQILEHGTGYITDIGMTGPKKSVIGMDSSVSIKRFETTLPEKYKLAEGSCMLNGCIFEINDETCRATKVIRITRK